MTNLNQRAISHNFSSHSVTAWSAAGAIAALSSAAIYNVMRSRKAERETPPVGAFVEVDGVRLHYLEAGAGPPLVLLHGNGATIQDYMLSGLLEEAAKRYRVIAFDRPGFGYSERPRSTIWSPRAQGELIHKALGLLGVERPIVLGHSWGTLAASAMALDHPEAAAALVLLSGYYFPTARLDTVAAAPPAIPVIGDVLRYTLSPIAGRAMAPTMFRAMFAPRAVPAVMGDWPLGLALRPSQIRASAADSAMMIPAAAQLSKRYDELQLPVVIAGGDEDKIVDFESQSVALNESLPNSRLIVIRGAGHMVHYAAPSTVIASIDRAHEMALAACLTETSAASGADIIPQTGAPAF